jgi:hypothetical protein
MDHTTRNETIRALAAASAAAIRMRPARALRAHASISGEIDRPDAMRLDEHLCSVRIARGPGARCTCCAELPPRRTTDRELPLERTPNHYTGEHRDEVAR